MDVRELLTVIELSETEKMMVCDKQNADANDEMEDYGLVEAEEAAATDMYEEEKMEDRERLEKMTTRTTARMRFLAVYWTCHS